MNERPIFVGQRLYSIVRLSDGASASLRLVRGFVTAVESEEALLGELEAVEDPFTPQSCRNWQRLPLKRGRLSRGVLGHTINGARLRCLLANAMHRQFEDENNFEECKALLLSLADGILEQSKGRKLEFLATAAVAEFQKLGCVSEHVWKEAVPNVLDVVSS